MTIKASLFGTGGVRLKTAAPVFEVGDFPEGGGYPTVWITERVEDDEGNYLGRTYVYPYPMDQGADPQGFEALELGAAYYEEGMGYADAADGAMRADCFRAAELLYLHAAAKGNAVAWLNLGYVYSYDRCAGWYFDMWAHDIYPFPRERRAFECFQKASGAGLAEADYKLGDMLRDGVGCQADAQGAFACYTRAFERGRLAEPLIWGSAALRLGDARENGRGCTQDFAKALEWYRLAATGLEAAVRAGEAWYARARDHARAGVKRCEQELSLAD